MPKLGITLVFNTTSERIYSFLRNAHESNNMKTARLSVLGFSIPAPIFTSDFDKKRLQIKSVGVDYSGNSLGQMAWTYELNSISENQTQVTITCQWNWVFQLFAVGKARFQAANNIMGRVYALEALAWRSDDVVEPFHTFDKPENVEKGCNVYEKSKDIDKSFRLR